MRQGPPIGALVQGDKARAIRFSSKYLPPLDVFNDDYDAYIASWEDLYMGGVGRWYDALSRDIYDLDARLFTGVCTHEDGEDEEGVEGNTAD